MDDRRRVAAAIRDYLACARISREQFAVRTKLGKSTVDKLPTGLFSDRALAIVESHTGLALRETADPPTPAATPRTQGPKPLDQPSIAVLPFVNLNADPEKDYLVDGISDDLITERARLRWLLVIARNSSFADKGKAVDVREVAQQLGVRYVLEGTVRRSLARFAHGATFVEGLVKAGVPE